MKKLNFNLLSLILLAIISGVIGYFVSLYDTKPIVIDWPEEIDCTEYGDTLHCTLSEDTLHVFFDNKY